MSYSWRVLHSLKQWCSQPYTWCQGKYFLYTTVAIIINYWSMVAKVTIDTDQGKVYNGNVYWHWKWSREFVWWYQVLWHVLHLTVYYYSGCAVLIVLIMEEEEEMVGRQFNSFKELQPSAYVGCTKSIKLHSYINS